jgi:hypothetical protein
MTKRVLIWLVLGTLFPAGLRAAENLLSASGFAFPSIQESGSARAIAMGSTYVGIAEGSASLLWNPAGLATLEGPEIALHHESGLVGATQEIAVLGVPLGYGNGLGLSVNYEDDGTFDGHDSTGAGTGDYSARAYGASLGWGIRGPLGLSLGLAAKVNRQEMASTDLNAFAGDAGVLWSLSPLLSVGAAYTNLGPEVNGQQLAQGFRAGISSYVGKCADYQWLFALSGEALTRSTDSVHLGVEHTLYHLLALRAGYAFDVSSPGTAGSLEGWTFGGGLIIKHGLSIDYAFVPLADLGNTQRVSLTYDFGEAPCKPTPAPTRARTDPPPPTPAPTLAPTPAATRAPSPEAARPVPVVLPLAWTRYVVKKGDSLWKISGENAVLGDSFYWPLIFKVNRDQISDPDEIEIGQDLRFSANNTQEEIGDAVKKAAETPRFAPHTTTRDALTEKY